MLLICLNEVDKELFVQLLIRSIKLMKKIFTLKIEEGREALIPK